MDKQNKNGRERVYQELISMTTRVMNSAKKLNLYVSISEDIKKVRSERLERAILEVEESLRALRRFIAENGDA